VINRIVPKPINRLFAKPNRALKHASFLRADAGFSITELAVVVAILSILSAIAIPSYIKSKNEATVAAVKVNLKEIIDECTVRIARNSSSAFTDTEASKAKVGGYELPAEKATYGCRAAEYAPSTTGELPTFSIAVTAYGDKTKACKQYVGGKAGDFGCSAASGAVGTW
jgi:prepilin-type N-terminal cleavage/methylation domain-containing protein